MYIGGSLHWEPRESAPEQISPITNYNPKNQNVRSWGMEPFDLSIYLHSKMKDGVKTE